MIGGFLALLYIAVLFYSFIFSFATSSPAISVFNVLTLILDIVGCVTKEKELNEEK